MPKLASLGHALLKSVQNVYLIYQPQHNNSLKYVTIGFLQHVAMWTQKYLIVVALSLHEPELVIFHQYFYQKTLESL